MHAEFRGYAVKQVAIKHSHWCSAKRTVVCTAFASMMTQLHAVSRALYLRC